MKKLFLTAGIGLLLAYGAFAQLAGRSAQLFNSGWFFYKGALADTAIHSPHFLHWKSVQLPHTWNDKDVLADGKRGYYMGTAWYKKKFWLQPEGQKKYYLRFEAANQTAHIYINGKLAGSHSGGYTAFNVDITPHLLPQQEQYVTVQVNNAIDPDVAPLSADFTFFGGIYRDVWLLSTGMQQFSMHDYGGPGVYITTPQPTPGRWAVEVACHIRNHAAQPQVLQVQAQVHDASTGRQQGTMQQNLSLRAGADTTITLRITNLQQVVPWEADNPYMYRLQARITNPRGEVVDAVEEPLGFRTFRFSADSGFYLNNKPLKLMGANRHQDRIPYGNALSPDMHRQDMELLKAMGGNFLRIAHYPQDREILHQADKLGLLVWEEIPLVNEITISEGFTNNALQMLREMIKQHHNHPSVVIWAYMNEIYWAHRFKPEAELPARNAFTVELAKLLEAETRRLDPHRYTAMAMHNYPAYEATGIDGIPMISAWNLYHGWYYDTFEDFGKYMDAMKARYPNRIYFISEYGAGAQTNLHSTRPEKFDFTAEGQTAFLQSYVRQIRERPYIAGGTVWNLVDFSSERRVDASSHMNDKGLVTHDRKPKDGYLLMQALLAKERVHQWGYPFRNAWTHAATHAADTLVPVRLVAYSNSKEATLHSHNGWQQTAPVLDGIATWELRLPPGQHSFRLGQHPQAPVKVITTRLIPFKLPAQALDLAVNLGANYSYTDPATGVEWIPEQAYVPGSWGFIGGKQVYVGNKVGTKEDILGIVHEDPLYQSMREGMQAFITHVPAGTYEVTLRMVDYVKRSRRFADEDSVVAQQPGQRLFDIMINGQNLQPQLDPGGQYGLNVPIELRYRLRVNDNEGIRIELPADKGQSIMSAIRIRSAQ